MDKIEIASTSHKNIYKDDMLVLLPDPEEVLKLDEQYVMRFVTCKTGLLTINYKGEETVVGPYQIMFLPPSSDNYLLSIKKSTDYVGSAFACKVGLVKTAFRYNTTMRNIAFYLHSHPVFHWQVDESFAYTIRDMFLYATNKHNAMFQEEMVRTLFLFILYAIISQIAEKTELSDERVMNRGEVQFMKFLGLLNQHFKKEREVAFYADKLHISPKYLSAICKSQSGRNASSWINDAVTEEIRYHLTHSDMSVKEICVMMNFPNISFFGRYVRKHLGYSPQAYRHLIHYNERD